MPKNTETKPPSLTALEERINAQAYSQARDEINELEKILADWSEKHETNKWGDASFFNRNACHSYDPLFSVPRPLTGTGITEDKKGWTAFREGYITERSKQLATDRARQLLERLDLQP